MSFAAEVAQAHAVKRGAAVAADPVSAVETKSEQAPAAAADGLAIPDSITVEPAPLPTGSAPVDPNQPVVLQSPTPKAGEEKPEPKTAPIKIAGKEFTSIDEAIAYAEQLEIANREDKAFKEGYEKGKPAEQTAPVKAEPLSLIHI